MLSVSKPIKGGQGEYYLSLGGADDYYLKGSEPPGFWIGLGAEALGLGGKVETEPFRNLLRGFSPEGERKLVRNADAERRAGWDLTWSPPKSVSVAWSQADPELRQRIEDCVRRAVLRGTRYLEEVAAITRRGEDGCIREKTKLIFAAFEHSTSRALDPQLHIHTVLLNLSVRADGSTGTIDPREIYRHQMAAGTLFRAELAALLERELGLRAMREGRAFELLGVDRELMAAFSQRRAAIEAALAERGLSGAKAAEIAALDTREKKQVMSREELFVRWQELGRAHQWGAKEVSFLVHAPFPERDTEKDRARTGVGALRQLTESDSHFSVRQLTQALAEEAQGRGLDANQVESLRDGLLGSKELIPLARHQGEMHWTTQEILDMERSLVRIWAILHERETPMEGADALVQETIGHHANLSSEHENALHHVCEAKGGVRVVSGMAGTGKSTLFHAARQVWADQGVSVVGAALSGKAARGLEESTGIQSRTIHQTLHSVRQGNLVLTPKTVLLVDEAAMVGTRQLLALTHACVNSGATLLLVGDARQLQAIGPGGAFAEISRLYGAAQLTEIKRQREAWAKTAVREFAAGEAESALSAYRQRGLVSATTQGRWSAMERLISEWSQGDPVEDRHTVILGGTNADIQGLNRLAQERRREAGCLKNEGVPVGEEQLFEGDRVLFTRNSMALSLMNGDRGTVRNVAGNQMTVELDSGRMVPVDTGTYPHVRLGYAMTTHKAQGMTCEKTFVLVSEQMLNRELTYVQASRARGETRWYLPDEAQELTRGMASSKQKQMAVSLGEPELQLTLER